MSSKAVSVALYSPLCVYHTCKDMSMCLCLHHMLGLRAVFLSQNICFYANFFQFFYFYSFQILHDHQKQTGSEQETKVL